MTEDMPEDVKAAALKLVTMLCKHPELATLERSLIADALMEQRLAERRRCAQIAEDRAKKSLLRAGGDESFYWEGSASAAQIIAAAIRGEGNGEG